MQTIEVIVSPQGNIRVETKGFTGSSCQSASRFLEQSLGLRQAEQLTAEFYAQCPAHQQLQEGQR